MIRLFSVLALACGFAANADAQTTLLRGRVATSGPDQFHLDSTKIPLTSASVKLDQWTGLDAIMKVVDVGTVNAPLLRVENIAASERNLDMSPLPLGGTGKFLVQAPPGAHAAIFLDLAANGAFTPLPALGTWLLGPAPHLVAVGVTDVHGQFPAKYAVASNPQLLGLLLTSQALIGDRGSWHLSNSDRQSIVP